MLALPSTAEQLSVLTEGLSCRRCCWWGWWHPTAAEDALEPSQWWSNSVAHAPTDRFVERDQLRGDSIQAHLAGIVRVCVRLKHLLRQSVHDCLHRRPSCSPAACLTPDFSWGWSSPRALLSLTVQQGHFAKGDRQHPEMKTSTEVRWSRASGGLRTRKTISTWYRGTMSFLARTFMSQGRELPAPNPELAPPCCRPCVPGRCPVVIAARRPPAPESILGSGVFCCVWGVGWGWVRSSCAERSVPH